MEVAETGKKPIAGIPYSTGANDWICTEQARLLQSLFPLLGTALGLGTIAALAETLRNPALWQHWAMLVTMIASVGACALALRWSYLGRIPASSYLILAVVTWIAVMTAALFDNLAPTSSMLALLVALLASVLISWRVAFGFGLGLAILGASYAILRVYGAYRPALDLGQTLTTIINLFVFVVTVFVGTYLIALSREGVHRAVAQLLHQSEEQNTANERLQQEIRERRRAEEALQKASDDMEQRVELRTRELTETNEALQAQITQRIRAEDDLRKLKGELESRVAERTAELIEMNTSLAREIQERKRAEVETLQRNRELLSLQAAAAATASSLDLPFVLDTVTWEMANMLQVEGCTIYEWHQEANVISMMAEYGGASWQMPNPGGTVRNLADYPQRAQVLMERRAMQTHRSQPETDAAERLFMQRSKINTLLLIPMVFQDRVVGLMEIRDGRTERTFTDHEITLAQWLATEAASAIENARLYEQAQRDLAERIRAEEQLKASLKEKEVLIKEIHHRVKNNLQVISSLLYLQSNGIDEEEVLGMFRDSQNRVRAMALIHERLYQSPDLARIHFVDYVQNLATYLVRSYGDQSQSIDLQVRGDDTVLNIDSAVPCGLIVNELVSNSLKHAFPRLARGATNGSAPGALFDGENGAGREIYIELRSDQNHQMSLIVRDNGVGFPDGLDFRQTDSLGLQLVNNLVSQIDGTIEMHSNGGTEFRIQFQMS
jgi:two-component sensor histidine kinase/large-conductance mechanosensitive channel